MNALLQAVNDAPPLPHPVLSSVTNDTPLTRVSLAFVEHRINVYLRFGHPLRTAAESLAALRGLHTGGCVLPRALGVQRLRYDTLAAHGAAGVHAARCGATHRGHPAGCAPASVRRLKTTRTNKQTTKRRHRSARHRSGSGVASVLAH